ncbi:ketol-acid reductoisomerase [Cutibacterium equinum]|uniref:Ketol-acid reductoisomerase (NADP(+)) n=1 Tax=Cutibacterium equinum TaxID=3016342 RepID=A0ABY7QVP6_9ACTN|nr:ketol-acid reductoisomerase [Cutibacterium equinum]WCC79147.1 ketol-acid reductoisomerase [Cutibacterium equinum]
MATIYHNDDADLSIIQDRQVAIIGYGSQGHAHALNLRDSGVDVRVGLPEGSSAIAEAEAEGLRVLPIDQACQEADVIMVLAPVQDQPQLYSEQIAPHLEHGDALFFAHGLNVHFGYITAPEGVDVSMVALTTPGHIARREYADGRGVPVLVCVGQDASGAAWDLTTSYAKALGGLRAGGIETTFREETETNLFGEQTVLGGLTHLVEAGFQTLVDAGYQPEMAYVQVCHEMNTIVDLFIEGGLSKLRRSMGEIAEYGDYVSGPRIVDDHVKENMRAVLDDIQTGAFAKRFIDDQNAGAPELTKLREDRANHPIESTGKQIGAMYSRLSTDEDWAGGSRAF